jgi:hypothetical protein
MTEKLRIYDQESFENLAISACGNLRRTIESLEKTSGRIVLHNPESQTRSLLLFLGNDRLLSDVKHFFTQKIQGTKNQIVDLIDSRSGTISFGSYVLNEKQEYGLFYSKNDTKDQTEQLTLELVERLSKDEDREIIEKFGKLSKIAVLEKIMDGLRPYSFLV